MDGAGNGFPGGRREMREAMAMLRIHHTVASGEFQEMDVNQVIFSRELAATFLGLLVFGVAYNYGIERVKWLKALRVADQVVIGVLVTILASGFVIGIVHMLQILMLFFASGSPMWIGSLIRAAQDAEQAKQIQKESVK